MPVAPVAPKEKSPQASNPRMADHKSPWRGNWPWIGGAVLVCALLGAIVLLYHPASIDTANGNPASTVNTSAPLGTHIHSLISDPNNSQNLFVGGHGGAEVSHDLGRTFQPIPDLANFDAMAWSVAADGRHQVVSGHYGLRTSADAGLHWTDLTAQLPYSDTHAVGLDPTAPSHLYAYFVGFGVYTSTDAGMTWQLAGGTNMQMMGPILVSPGGAQLLAIDMMSGLVASTDGGHTWATRSVGLQAAWLAADPHNPQRILAAGGTAIELSGDGGATWTPVVGPLGAASVAISQDGTWRAVAMGGAGQPITYASTDQGQHWQQTTA